MRGALDNETIARRPLFDRDVLVMKDNYLDVRR